MTKIRTFDFPDDLVLLQALSPEPETWTVRELHRRLDYLSACIKNDVVPDAKGRFLGVVDVPAWWYPYPDSNAGRRFLGVYKRGKRQWKSVPVPPELEKKMAGLAEVVPVVRELLNAGEIGKAGDRMGGIQALVADMAARAAPITERGRQKSMKGGKMKRGKYGLGPKTPSKLRDAVRRKLAERPGRSLTNARRLVAKDLGVSFSTVKNHTKGISL